MHPFKHVVQTLGFNDVSVLGNPTINGAMVDTEAIALLKMICDLAQRYDLEVQIKGGSHNAWVVLHALKTFVWNELPRARLARNRPACYWLCHT